MNVPSQLLFFLQDKTTKRNSLTLFKFFVLLAIIIITYSLLFHLIMLYEGRNFSWITGFYWTLTVMSTLGFGDITFTSDLGLSFTLLVLFSGIILLLIMLPFCFIQFFYAPWLKAQEDARIPRQVATDMNNHVIFTHYGPITQNLITKFKKHGTKYVVVVEEMQQALELANNDISVVLGELDHLETYENLQIHSAALVVATNDDLTNTSISFTIRELTDKVPIISNADKVHSRDILEFPGNTTVFEFMKELGQSLARRTLGLSRGANIIGNFESLLIAEAPAMRTAIEGKKLQNSEIRERTGLTVVGIWDKGIFEIARPETVITSTSVLMLTGTAKQLSQYDRAFAVTCANFNADAPVLILGGGRVGCATAETLAENNVSYKIVEQSKTEVNRNKKHRIHGDAADINVLKEAGIDTARAVIITPHDDAINIYLTFYCRQLRPDVQIISRATNERNIPKLHRAGADMVMSYAALGANTIFNLLQPNKVSMFAEGLNIFSRNVPHSLHGKPLTKAHIRRDTGCNVIAIQPKGQEICSPTPDLVLQKKDTLLLVGSLVGEDDFDQKFGEK